MSEYYIASGNPLTDSQGMSQLIRNEFKLIQAATDKLPQISGNSGKVVGVKDGSLGVFTSTEVLAAAGISANSAELSYCSGLTGNIQSQINNIILASGGEIDTSAVQGIVGGMIAAGTQSGGITVTYDDAGNAVDFALDSMTDSSDTQGTLAGKIFKIFEDISGKLSIGNQSSAGTFGASVGVNAVSGNAGFAGGNASSAGGNAVSVGAGSGAGDDGVTVGYGALSDDGVTVGRGSISAGASVSVGRGVLVTATNGIGIGNNFTVSEDIVKIGRTTHQSGTFLAGHLIAGGSGVVGTEAYPTGGDWCLILLNQDNAVTAAAANTTVLYSTDITAGNTTLAIYTEGSPITTETPAATDSTLTIKVNGQFYKIPAIAI